MHPALNDRPFVDVKVSPSDGSVRNFLRVGVVLSGGPAPGGHSVIAGLYDFIKNANERSILFGFIRGIEGLFADKYSIINEDFMNNYRNLGGFDMLGSGRGKVSTESDLETVMRTCQMKNLNGLVIVGGDGSLSNAALIADYFGQNLPSCKVIGVPKTIDGDLKNEGIEISFGFDTASKVYSELIGNLCTDVSSAHAYYHFVRIMGRSASHLAFECALQTRPNLLIVGEEINQLKTTLAEIVEDISQMIVERAKNGIRHGVILVPEGLIEFIPEVSELLQTLNRVTKIEDIPESATASELKLWNLLPETLQQQLLSDRESTGYIQVAKIATERLLIVLVRCRLTELSDGYTDLELNEIRHMSHYFGYEGRCAPPSVFDCNYSYALGYNAGALLENGLNGYISIIRNLKEHPSKWRPSGGPLLSMMEVLTRDDGRKYSAMCKSLLDLDSELFKTFKKVRAIWRMNDCYTSPGPIQFEGPTAGSPCLTISNVKEKTLIPELNPNLAGKVVFTKSIGHMSEIQKIRQKMQWAVPSTLTHPNVVTYEGAEFKPKDAFLNQQISTHFPHLFSKQKYLCQEFVQQDGRLKNDRLDTSNKQTRERKIGVVICSQPVPGVENILWGLFDRLQIIPGSLVGFFGIGGLLGKHFVDLNADVMNLFYNMGGSEILGRTYRRLTVDVMEDCRIVCEEMKLDGIVIIGSSIAITDVGTLAEYFAGMGCLTKVVGIPATGSNNVQHPMIETCLGFNTTSRTYAYLIGNLLTDAASMPKYWHFIRLMGRDPSCEVLECALQTHPNIVLIGEEYGEADKTLMHIVQDIADVVCKRSENGKNYGTVLIPEGLISHLPNMKNLFEELSEVKKMAIEAKEEKKMEHDLVTNISENPLSTHAEPPPKDSWATHLTPWSLALFRSLPKFIRQEFFKDNFKEVGFAHIETEQLLAQLVTSELHLRAQNNKCLYVFIFVVFIIFFLKFLGIQQIFNQ
eukprot:GHVL01042327.1.p1 GENE.GHVL01042327.1~~GHVL01042327.1.p1  ORF type:complete len:1046 (-),score=195.00 GHVL01042327.1:1248-4169(-)